MISLNIYLRTVRSISHARLKDALFLFLICTESLFLCKHFLANFPLDFEVQVSAALILTTQMNFFPSSKKGEMV